MGILYLLLAEVYRKLMGFLNGTELAVHSFGAISGYLLGSALFVGDSSTGEATKRHQTYRIVAALYYMFFLIVLIVANVFFI